MNRYENVFWVIKRLIFMSVVLVHGFTRLKEQRQLWQYFPTSRSVTSSNFESVADLKISYSLANLSCSSC